jgi:hypothetical protein
MNERIQELMVKAGFDVERLRMYPGGFPREDLLVLEDFAKLIVEECAALCDLYAMPDGTSETAIILASAIRRKFGIEQ